MRFGVVGSRFCTPVQFSAVCRMLENMNLAPGTVVVTGDCETGVDEAVRFWCRHEWESSAVVHEAQKRPDGKWLGPWCDPERNARLVADVDSLLGLFTVRRADSQGTAGCLELGRARRPKIMVREQDLTMVR